MAKTIISKLFKKKRKFDDADLVNSLDGDALPETIDGANSDLPDLDADFDLGLGETEGSTSNIDSTGDSQSDSTLNVAGNLEVEGSTDDGVDSNSLNADNDVEARDDSDLDRGESVLGQDDFGLAELSSEIDSAVDEINNVDEIDSVGFDESAYDNTQAIVDAENEKDLEKMKVLRKELMELNKQLKKDAKAKSKELKSDFVALKKELNKISHSSKLTLTSGKAKLEHLVHTTQKSVSSQLAEIKTESAKIDDLIKINSSSIEENKKLQAKTTELKLIEKYVNENNHLGIKIDVRKNNVNTLKSHIDHLDKHKKKLVSKERSLRMKEKSLLKKFNGLMVRLTQNE